MLGFLSTPLAMLALAGWLSVAGTYGVMWVSREAAKASAYAAGHEAGYATVSAKGVEGAEKTARARLAAEAEIPAVPADKAALAALCKREASCRDRGNLK